MLASANPHPLHLMTKSELLSAIAEWTADLWEAESNGWGNSAGECKEVLERLYALLSTLS
jgi:hypothetical protein